MGAQEDFTTLSELAERLQLSEEESEGFIKSAMSRLGHKAKTMWEDFTDDNGNGNSGDFFSKQRQNNTRRVPGQGEKKSTGTAPWGYQ